MKHDFLVPRTAQPCCLRQFGKWGLNILLCSSHQLDLVEERTVKFCAKILKYVVAVDFCSYKPLPWNGFFISALFAVDFLGKVCNNWTECRLTRSQRFCKQCLISDFIFFFSFAVDGARFLILVCSPPSWLTDMCISMFSLWQCLYYSLVSGCSYLHIFKELPGKERPPSFLISRIWIVLSLPVHSYLHVKNKVSSLEYHLTSFEAFLKKARLHVD